ncbi:MAG: amidohydrolase [Chloroflexota bacterium]|jgi:amidohydrolase|nr:amidohydrolase [Dehalococcoidia bacterium]MED5208628.1 amidohydrolase [Chloroflexota bacterium]MEE3013801.1 amidohydrolase [Chloroflexota bacterium]|tara:strand:- start:2515 stop:3846 length:1332 start_codon:yes stop_codon:yes gene_type:complete
MPSKEDLKRRADEIIDAKADDLISIAKTILSNPEPGFREVKTAKLVAEQFGSLGLQPRSGLAITGVRADASGSTPGPTMAVLGELDSLIVGEHPHADPNTNAAHACGHHCQIAMMLGAASALTSSDILESLAGRIAFMAVPAEEYIEIEYRDGLRKDGKIEFLGGKPEMVRLGEFDDVHLAMMLHTTSNPAEQQICISNTNNGSVAKRIQFIGRASHAGGAPHLGVNALNAAMMAMTAINFNRETFRDEDSIRVHPIITKGGEAVSAVPADVRMETFVRGRNLEALMDANTKVDRALRAGAMAVGADVKIQTIPGYMPLQQHKGMAEIFRANAVNLVGEDNVSYVNHRGGSTDMGDISRLMPVIHPYIGGAVGLGHGATYVIEDYSLAVIKGAKALAYTVIDLLGDNAAHGNSIVGGQRPDMSISEYLKFMRNLASEETYKGG